MIKYSLYYDYFNLQVSLVTVFFYIPRRIKPEYALRRGNAFGENQKVTGIGSECTGNYRNERDRVKTFTNWPTKEVNPLDLAKRGFFYTQSGDGIQCAFCGLQLANWCPDCDPNLHHKMYSNECDFLKKRECGNIPM